MEKQTDNGKFINTIKLLIYQEDKLLLENLDFEKEEIFLHPILFAYFNAKKKYRF